MENEMKVGDIVKSYDFNGFEQSYMIGKVVEFTDDGRFKAKLLVRVWDHKVDENQSEFFLAPLQGSMFMDNDANPRVMVIG
jgi:hypothetical protein